MSSGDEYVPPVSLYGGRVAKVSRLMVETAQDSVYPGELAETTTRLFLSASENLYTQLGKEIVEEFFPPQVNIVKDPYEAGRTIVMVMVSARVYI